MLQYLTILEYASFFFSPSIEPYSPSNPGSLKYTSSDIIIAYNETNTYNNVDIFGSQFSAAFPLHVPNSDKQTFPHAYKFGLNLTLPPPVVTN